MLTSILVTGGAGFIGQNFVHYLVKASEAARIVVLDKFTYASNPTSLDPLVASGRVELVHGDIAHLDTVREIIQSRMIDTIVHFAAETHVDRSIHAPDAFIDTNIIGTYNLLKSALVIWQTRKLLHEARFLHVSTDEVFGDLTLAEPAFTERSSYRPSSPYSASKAASDHLARAFHRTYGLPVIVTNCSNNYGPYQHPEKLIPIMITNALRGRPLPLYGDGQNVRDWLFVTDHCQGIWSALKNAVPGSTYAFGGRAERSNRTVVEAICAMIDEHFRDPNTARKYPDSPSARGTVCRELIKPVEDRAGHDRRYAIDPSLAEKELGFKPSVSFEEGLRATVAWYVEHEAWWRQALSPDFADWIARNYGPQDANLTQR